MKKEVIDLVNDNLNTLKDNIKDDKTYGHIIESVLEIYTNVLPYNQVFEQITNDIENINEEENSEVWGSIYFLTRAISGNDPVVRYFYQQEILENKEEWKSEITGEIYNFIDQNG